MRLDITIKPAGPEDTGLVLPLVLNQFSEHSIPLEKERLENSIQKVLADDRLGFFLVAWAGRSVAGFAYVALTWSLEHSGRSAWLEELYVRPELRNQGIGRRLLDEVLDRAAGLGAGAVDLEVDRDLARAENLYRRNGFAVLPRARWVRNLNKNK
jgi:GNAT superfamily N-acetyltransferase